MMSNKTYDILKGLALTVLPALAALYLGLAKIWGLPYQTEVAGTITLIDTFLGTLLGLSSKTYKKKQKEGK